MDDGGEMQAAREFVAPQGGGLTDAQAARQRAAARQAAKRGQQAGVPRAFALPAASAGDSDGSAGSSGSDEEQEEEDSPRAKGKRPAAGGKANAEAERERKRMRRLLRNRVSAQLARERKKQHAATVEVRAVELEGKARSLAARVAVLERENSSLRQVLRTTLGREGRLPVAALAPPVF